MYDIPGSQLQRDLTGASSPPDTSSDRLKLEGLVESERMFRAAMENSPIGMALTRMDGSWIDVNPALCDFLGYSKEELMEAGFKNVTHAEDREATVLIARRMVATHQKSVRLEKRYIHSSGRIVIGILHLTVVRDDADRPVMFISQITDVTAARQLDHLKSEFIHTVNHELRTPLTGIMGSLRLLEVMGSGAAPEKIANLVGVASKNAARLKSLLDDILEMETVVSDQSFWIANDVRIQEAVERAVTASEKKAEAAGIRIIMDPEGAPLVCETHPERLGRVLRILLSNAVKYSDPGGTVRIGADWIADKARITVTNGGMPIPEAMRVHIFQPFVQGESTDTRRKQGSGLGLSIAKHLINSIGGEIDFSSTTKATRFWVHIPLRRVQ